MPLGRGENGEPLLASVQELKAAYLNSDVGDLTLREQAFAQKEAVFEGRQMEREQEVISARQELSQMAALLQKYVPPAALKASLDTVREGHRREAEKLLERVPRFREAGAFQAFQKDAQEAMGAFGFSKAEALAISDHRVYQMLDTFVRMKKRLAKLDKAAQGDRPAPPRVVKRRSSGKPPPKGQKAVEAARQPGASRATKVQGVAALLSGE